VADRLGQISAFTRLGQRIRSFATYGQAGGQLHALLGLAMSHHDSLLWIADQLNHRIAIWSITSDRCIAVLSNTDDGLHGGLMRGDIGPFRNVSLVAVSEDGRVLCLVDGDSSLGWRLSFFEVAFGSLTTDAATGTGRNGAEPTGVTVVQQQEPRIAQRHHYHPRSSHSRRLRFPTGSANQSGSSSRGERGSR
jgi:hypothetical protein